MMMDVIATQMARDMAGQVGLTEDDGAGLVGAKFAKELQDPKPREFLYQFAYQTQFLRSLQTTTFNAAEPSGITAPGASTAATATTLLDDDGLPADAVLPSEIEVGLDPVSVP